MIHLFSLYFLDSHARQKKRFPWDETDYDYLKPLQIEWFKNTSAHIKPIERPFNPDGVDDLGPVWRRGMPARRRIDKQRQEKTLAKPNAIMFFHIPLAESYGPVDISEDGDILDVGTEIDGDAPGNSQTNSGFFEKGLLKALAIPESSMGEDTGTDNPPEVKVIGHGHCHNTDKCRRQAGIWACFGGGSSYSGYGHIGFDRRFRVYELSDFGERVVSYKRTDAGGVVDKQVLVQ